MAKEPWQEDIYDQEESRAERRHRNHGGADRMANRILTILASIFFVIVVVMVIVLIYLSSGGSNRTAALKDFHDSDASVVQISSSSSSQPEQSSEEAANPEGTIKVLAGEGEAAIAARAGISIAQLEALNPGHMATGSWFANPGDVIKIK
ncbi:30S ribosomal protein S15 [Streptococcus pneumoniae]|uniref:SAG1386/EF1546 family surface-associated protein n=1 Tax=Streptococcus pneumoniae TaxID=1313 RepID=UPI0010241F8F|nr:SAG1386/EF1546 family surface-associated protein [Streptococcus pneumoniae]VFH51210.1 30S ribosomal protein S15 [Streptococcus pneumoniae]VMA78214.1 30S ribosomal protein S15 [Streptococcus pneumoniae]VMD76245.1 30S ribosomal protein S15 [Streptococcus pneumoniae]VPF22408.1 30S ribosomal protein S15 [Streptococcus pneumoniae]VPI40334.1 30S ribosomal protein S15 [Streptococcus pneumoniae]